MRNAPPDTRDPYLLGSLRKGLEVLDCFSRQESWSLAELAAVLRQSKPTIFRVLHTLEFAGWLERHAATGRYAQGRRLQALGAGAGRQEQLRWQALPPLQDLARHTGETVHLGVLYGAEAVCVQAVEGTRLVRMHATVGRRTPAHASALGKVLLAHLPAAERDASLRRRSLPGLTPRTLTSARALRAELDRIRAQGWALDDEEMETGLRCLGAPVLDGAGRAVASIALSAPAARMEAPRLRDLTPLLQAAARRITTMLGPGELAPAA